MVGICAASWSNEVSDERQATEGENALQRRIELLAREIADAINAGQADEREVLREFAVNVVRDQVQVVDRRTAAAAPGATALGPIAIAIPFLMMGAVLIFLFPLMGLAMFGAASVMITWGVVAALFGRK